MQEKKRLCVNISKIGLIIINIIILVSILASILAHLLRATTVNMKFTRLCFIFTVLRNSVVGHRNMGCSESSLNIKLYCVSFCMCGHIARAARGHVNLGAWLGHINME